MSQTSNALTGLGDLQATLDVDGANLSGVRGGVRAGVRGAEAGGVRGGVRGGPRRQEGATTIYTVTYTFDTPPESLIGGTHRLHPIFIRASDPAGQERGLCWFEFDKELTPDGQLVVPTIDPSEELFGLPDEDKDGVSNLIELSLGSDPADGSSKPDEAAAAAKGFDLTPPETTITAGCPSASTASEVKVDFSCADPAGSNLCGFRCRLDTPAGEGKITVCKSPFKFTPSAAGAHTLTVRAVDGFGNPDASPATCQWTQ